MVALTIAPSIESRLFIPLAMACYRSSHAMKAYTLFKVAMALVRECYAGLYRIDLNLDLREIGVFFFFKVLAHLLPSTAGTVLYHLVFPNSSHEVLKFMK